MTRLLFVAAFLLGAIAVVWMGYGFVGSDLLALVVTVVIGIVYTIGFVELVQFRRATSTLASLLSHLENNSAEAVASLDNWLKKLHPSLQNSVRLRVEGERVGLPAPVLTPYLVGLLVMLGLLGTFVGMVDTLKGAVIALEGTTELQAIREGLTAPIKGLGLAFGTSVAGVAASAMLGLISTLSRRDRMVETRRLDTQIATELREFSLVHNRQETYRALQVQASALPEVAEKLQLMATQMERVSDNLGNKLIASQESFHSAMRQTYEDLASSVDKSLRESLSESGRQAGESIQPVVESTMRALNESALNTQAHLTQTVQDQLVSVTGQFSKASEDVSDAWKEGLVKHGQASDTLIDGMTNSLKSFTERFEETAVAVTENVGEATAQLLQKQEDGDKQRLDQWTSLLTSSQENMAGRLEGASKNYTESLHQVMQEQQESIHSVTQQFESIASTITDEWKRAGEQSQAQGKKISESLEQAASNISDSTTSATNSVLKDMSDLLQTSEQLVDARVQSEAQWLSDHDKRMEGIAETLKTELSNLRDEEARRGEAAVDRLAGLEDTVTSHLRDLGRSLEEPMARLIETASETPKAAAEVIGQLRQEISNNIERDNTLLEERKRTMNELDALIRSLEESSSGQREVIEQLVNSSADVMENVSTQFSQQVGQEVTKLSGIAESLAGNATEIADNFSGSAAEMSSLGEAFGVAVTLFNESNQHLIENLSRIEESLEKSTTRSDEQLGYYIAQAKEIIDHSMLSQREVFEELRQISRSNESAQTDPLEIS